MRFERNASVLYEYGVGRPRGCRRIPGTGHSCDYGCAGVLSRSGAGVDRSIFPTALRIWSARLASSGGLVPRVLREPVAEPGVDTRYHSRGSLGLEPPDREKKSTPLFGPPGKDQPLHTGCRRLLPHWTTLGMEAYRSRDKFGQGQGSSNLHSSWAFA